MTEPKDYRDTVFLPKTDFPMKAGLPAKEPGILAKWQAADQYRELRNRRKGREKFILHDGPPYANGDMHIGHALNHILKDMVVRTQTLLGKDAPYVPGWDCHGLPIEWKVEEEYRKKKLNKDEVPVKEFRAECRAYAQKWVDVQREQLKRLGIGGDWDNPYLTMDFAAEATIVTELMTFAESGQLYRGAKPVMWSPVEKTALAEAEVEYEDITSTQIDVAFEIVSSPIPELVGAHAVIWTTTPWTIPVNQALAYGPDVEYALYSFELVCSVDDDAAYDLVRQRLTERILDFESRRYLLARPLAESVLARINRVTSAVDCTDIGCREQSYMLLPANGTLDPNWLAQSKFNGSELAGAVARHPMHHLGGFFAKPRPFLPGDFVTTETGTGLVHMAPDHGEDDFDLCKANGLEPQFAVMGDGKYRADWAWLGGQGSVINPKFNAPDGPICSDLREAGGLLAASSDYKHSYPHSWRSKAKVIYRCTPQWFVGMDRPINPSPLEGEGGAHAPGEGAGAPMPEGSHPSPAATKHADGVPSLAPSPSRGEGLTLRQTALTAIENTRWVPEKGRNRINSMVEGRPDWVLSRQRAWGVPITLFVDRKTGQYLYDEAVNARIIAAVREVGVDAWCDERAQEYLGADYNAADYERVVDILDVWFDSGCTHAFVLESGKWPDLARPGDHVGPWADLYLEGTDQHRGWFQSSLLESCGTRGHAPYKAVLTHGFTMDQKGMKMSKSLGNTISPTDLMRDSGADILRLWALSVDFTEDHRIGKEILSGVSDQYRKLRNSFRYLLGALEGFSDAEKVAVADMPELERYVLHLLADMDGKLRQAVDDFDFNTYVRLITDFANNDLSAFFFDIRKDSLYCDAVTSPKRMAYRTVLDILFHALVRYAAPVLVFTAEEVWQTRFPDDAESVHFLEWPEVDAGWKDESLESKFEYLRFARESSNTTLEYLRRNKVVGSSLEVTSRFFSVADFVELAPFDTDVLSEIAIVSAATIERVSTLDHDLPALADPEQFEVFKASGFADKGVFVTHERTTHHKCGRCWRHLPKVTEDGSLCGRCDDVVNG
jgi:isoleucyl-tRNA synthetase